MNTLLRSLVISLIIVFVTACGGGETPTSKDTPLVFSAFPPGYFDGNYSASYSLTGSATDGNNYTATWNIQSGTDTTFNSKPVKTIEKTLTTTNTATNAVVVGAVHSTYFTTDINNLTVEGTNSLGVSYMPTSTTVIPLTASIGDSGSVGSYAGTDGSSSSTTWSIEDGFNGKAKLVITEVINDASSVLYATQIQKWLISQDGSISGVEAIVTYHQNTNRIVTWTGS